MAFAISHIWRWETDMLRIGVLRLTVSPSLRNRSAASLRMRPSSTMPKAFVGKRPRNRLSLTLRSRHWLSSWCTIAMPFSRASLGPEKATSLPLSRMVPSSFW